MPRGVPPAMDECGDASRGSMGFLTGDAAVQKGRVREIPTGCCLDVCFGIGMFFIFMFWKRAPTVCFQILRGHLSHLCCWVQPTPKAQVRPSMRWLPDAGAVSGASSDRSHLLSATHGVCRTQHRMEM